MALSHVGKRGGGNNGVCERERETCLLLCQPVEGLALSARGGRVGSRDSLSRGLAPSLLGLVHNPLHQPVLEQFVRLQNRRSKDTSV